MFCPTCATENDHHARFCRQCGQPLKAVALAVDGQADECIEKFKQAGESLVSGIVTFAIFFVLAIVAYIPFGPWPAAINLLLALIFSVPQIVKGLLRHRAAHRILAAGPGSSLTDRPKPAPAPAARTIESIEPPSQIAGSVTEHTTLQLESPESRK